MSDNGGGYFSRSSALLKRDQGWIKPLLVLGVSMFVPVVGQLGVEGYALEWARLTAWGIDSAPKQKNVQVGQCIKSGWRGFVSIVGWAAIYGVVVWLLTWLAAGSDALGDLVGLLLTVAGLFMAVIYAVCQVRATIYQSFKAGYQADRILDMLKRDFGGIARIAGMTLVMSLVMGAVAAVLAIVLFVPSILGVAGAAYGDYYMSERMVISQVVQAIAGMVPLFVLYFYVVCVAAAYVKLITDTAVALWMRQFNVPQWGASADPLPPEQPVAYASPRAGLPEQAAYGAQPDQGQWQPVSYQQPAQGQGAWQQAASQQTHQQPPAQQGQWQQPAPVQQYVPQEVAPAPEPAQQAPSELPTQAGAQAPAAYQGDQTWQGSVSQPDGGWEPLQPASQDVPARIPVAQEATAPTSQPAPAMPDEVPVQPGESEQPEPPADEAPTAETPTAETAVAEAPTVPWPTAPAQVQAEAGPQPADEGAKPVPVTGEAAPSEPTTGQGQEGRPLPYQAAEPGTPEVAPADEPAATEPSAPEAEPQPVAGHHGVSPLGDLKPVEVQPVEPLAPVNLDVSGETEDDSQR